MYWSSGSVFYWLGSVTQGGIICPKWIYRPIGQCQKKDFLFPFQWVCFGSHVKLPFNIKFHGFVEQVGRGRRLNKASGKAG
jgi:hypothetical protein